MNYIKTVALGFLGGFIALALFLSLPGGGSIVFNLIKNDLVDFLGKKPSPTPTPTAVSPDFWQKIVTDRALNMVAVQSFKDGKIIREGSGMVISSDGVIVTTLDVVSGADVLQMFHKDKILRAQMVKYNSLKNLALLKVDSANMDVAGLERNYQFQSGQDIVISGKLVRLSNSAMFAQRGMISYAFSKDVVLDTEPNYFLSGSQVITNSGAIVGMAYLRSGAVRLITAETIDDFVKEYFKSI